MTITQKILNKIIESTKIIIHRHQSPDPDALGSQGGLANLLKASFPEKEIYCVGGEVNDLDYLLMMETVSDDLYQEALVIVTDTANEPRISGDQYKLADFLIKIDHHPDDTPYGNLSWVNPKASSTSEMIYDFYYLHQDKLMMTDEAARLLYAGIVGDTGRFLYPSTTSHTFWVASQLVEYSFDATEINLEMDEVSEKIASLSGHILKNLVVDETGVAMVLLSQEVLDEFDLTDSETSAIIPLPGKIKGIKAWGIFVQQPEGGYRVRLRSKGPVINTIAKRHNGGGHPLASGANAKDLEEVKEIYQEIKEAVKNNN